LERLTRLALMALEQPAQVAQALARALFHGRVSGLTADGAARIAAMRALAATSGFSRSAIMRTTWCGRSSE
jgi:hypothetical protein